MQRSNQARWWAKPNSATAHWNWIHVGRAGTKRAGRRFDWHPTVLSLPCRTLPASLNCGEPTAWMKPDRLLIGPKELQQEQLHFSHPQWQPAGNRPRNTPRNYCPVDSRLTGEGAGHLRSRRELWSDRGTGYRRDELILPRRQMRKYQKISDWKRHRKLPCHERLIAS